MLRDPAFFRRPNNIASRGRGGGKNRSATKFRKNAPKYAIFSTVLSKIVEIVLTFVEIGCRLRKRMALLTNLHVLNSTARKIVTSKSSSTFPLRVKANPTPSSRPLTIAKRRYWNMLLWTICVPQKIKTCQDPWNNCCFLRPRVKKNEMSPFPVSN